MSAPVVDLLVSMPSANNGSMTTASSAAPPARTARTPPRPALRPDDSEVPPEAGAISEQPALSHVQHMQAEMDMHRVAAQRGVAFASHSERVSDSIKRSKRGTNNGAASSSGSRNASARPSQRGSHTNGSARNPSSSASSSSYSSRGHPSVSSRERYVDAPQAAAAAAAMHAPPPPLPKNVRFEQTARDEIATNNAGGGGGTDDKPNADTVPFFHKVKQFVSKNLLLVIAAVVMLVLVGVGVFLLFRSNIEDAQRERERLEAQQVLELEREQPQRDYALNELRAQHLALKQAYDEAARVCAAYEAELDQYRQQTELQMEQLEHYQLFEQRAAEYAEYAAALEQQLRDADAAQAAAETGASDHSTTTTMQEQTDSNGNNTGNANQADTEPEDMVGSFFVGGGGVGSATQEPLIAPTATFIVGAAPVFRPAPSRPAAEASSPSPPRFEVLSPSAEEQNNHLNAAEAAQMQPELQKADAE